MTIKVCDLAKKLGLKSKDIVTKAGELGIVAKAANSSISEEEANKIEEDIKSVREEGRSTSRRIGKPITKAEAEKRKKPAGRPITKAEKLEKDIKAAKDAKEIEKFKEEQIAQLEEKLQTAEKKKAEDVQTKKKKQPKKPTKNLPNQPKFTGPKIIKTAAEIKAEEEQKALAKMEKAKEEAREKKQKQDFSNAPTNPEKKDTRKKKKNKNKNEKDRDDRDKRHKNKKDKYDSMASDYSLEKKAKKKHKKQKQEVIEEVETEIEEMPVGTRVINVPITVAGFCEQVEVSVSKVIMTLMKLGVITNVNANLDEDTALLLAEELGISVVIGDVEEEIIEEGIENFEDTEEQLLSRPPIITVMGHVDHGKTSLLDAIRATNVTAKESGGITQHIGASEVRHNNHRIVFLDTPGHEAFTAMRARGADITDIAVLVVAADDSVKPQTIESISHAKAAGVPIIVAINKIDKPGANLDKVKADLAEHGILVEDWGGEVISVPVSAKTGEGIEELLEMILLQSEVLELKANPKRLGLGTVIEARLDKAKGPVASLLVTNGTVKSGQSIVAGNTSGRIRLMTDYKGETIKKATPATAVEILGLTDVPAAGDDFHIVKDDKTAREIASNRQQKLREEILARNASSSLEELFKQLKEGEVKDLNLLIKGDVMGSVGAIISSLEKLSNENVRVNIVHSAVGAITESDVTLASTAGAVIIGFNVRPANGVQNMADMENVQIRTYRVIYNIIDDVENAMKGMLDPEFKEVVLGQVEIRETFKVPNVGTIGGGYVIDGKITRNAEVRIVRDGIVIHEGKMASLRRFKDDVKEVQSGYECGIGIENYNDLKEGDVIECFEMQEIVRD